MGTSSSSEGGAKEDPEPQARPPPSRDEEQTPENMSYWQMARQGYQELVNAIIRPPRAEYAEEDLGPKDFKISTKGKTLDALLFALVFAHSSCAFSLLRIRPPVRQLNVHFRPLFAGFKRTDLQLTNPRGMVLQCSHWEPKDRPAAELPCVIYLHGNSSCRVEATSILTVALCSGLTVFAFDFSGSGQSGGEWVSLGFFERDDLQTVTDYLRSTRGVSTIGLWGRSMGAATALLHGDRDPSIAGLVLDSAFADLDQLALEMVERGRQEGLNVPGFVVKAAMAMIRSSVQKRAGFSTKELVSGLSIDL
jgi:acetyl esterase/lipase